MIHNKTNRFIIAAFLIWLLAQSATGIEIVVDYTYDTEGFFSDPATRIAIEAVAERYSRVVTSELTAVAPLLGQQPWRIGFQHPGTGESVQISTASNQSNDPIFDAANDIADVYGFDGLDANEWILFVGGRNLVASGVGGTGTGINFTTVFDDLDGPMHRGVISNTPDQSANDIPAWGGAVSFDTGTDFHFDLNGIADNGVVDFYSIAMHEVGHVLGLGTQWNQWSQHVDVGVDELSFQGSAAVAAYNADNNTNVAGLTIDNGGHWQDSAYLSKIFQPGEPNLVGTVGDGLQDLLLEPFANFTPTKNRFELTNVDAAALVDLGWAILEDTGDPLDLNGDGAVNSTDVDLACSVGNELEPYFAELNSLQGDLDFSTDVGFSDFLILSSNFGAEGDYSTGDVNCNGAVGFDDFLIVSSVFGESRDIAAVPEPNSVVIVLGFVACVGLCRRRRSACDNDPSACS